MPPPETEESHEPDKKIRPRAWIVVSGLHGRPTRARPWARRPGSRRNRNRCAVLGLGMGLRLSVLSGLLLPARRLRVPGIPRAADDVHPAGCATGARGTSARLLVLLH